ncbi:UNVERIFIED_CONTAM: hypothetical protein Sradi_7098000 [Sesamum radiatum]|uniref:Uncharacterized protein n=1 Tax=Sesamum radiatum TaxID=300843 RepID=A0AAW2J490_SESRA
MRRNTFETAEFCRKSMPQRGKPCCPRRGAERATRAYAARGAAPPVRKVTPPGRLDVPRVAPR